MDSQMIIKYLDSMDSSCLMMSVHRLKNPVSWAGSRRKYMDSRCFIIFWSNTHPICLIQMEDPRNHISSLLLSMPLHEFGNIYIVYTCISINIYHNTWICCVDIYILYIYICFYTYVGYQIKSMEVKATWSGPTTERPRQPAGNRLCKTSVPGNRWEPLFSPIQEISNRTHWTDP